MLDPQRVPAKLCAALLPRHLAEGRQVLARYLTDAGFTRAPPGFVRAVYMRRAVVTVGGDAPGYDRVVPHNDRSAVIQHMKWNHRATAAYVIVIGVEPI